MPEPPRSSLPIVPRGHPGFPARPRPGTGGAGVPGGEQPGHGPHGRVNVHALPHQPGKAALPRHTAHHDEGFWACPSPGCGIPPGRGRRRGRVMVQRDFPLAGGPARHHGGVVQEPEVDRFLDLVGAVADEEHHGGMGLAHLRTRARLSHGGLRRSGSVRDGQRPASRGPGVVPVRGRVLALRPTTSSPAPSAACITALAGLSSATWSSTSTPGNFSRQGRRARLRCFCASCVISSVTAWSVPQGTCA